MHDDRLQKKQIERLTAQSGSPGRTGNGSDILGGVATYNTPMYTMLTVIQLKREKHSHKMWHTQYLNFKPHLYFC